MSVSRYQIVRDRPELIELKLHGAIDHQVVAGCEQAARTALSVAKPGRVRLLIDLSELDEYTLDAREALVELQQHLSTKVACTAAIATTTQGRALALWVSRMTPEQPSACFASRDDAIAWLHGFRGPVTAVRPRMTAESSESDEAAG